MDILADYMVNPDISLLDKVKIQTQVLLPLIKTLRQELGEEKANEVVRSSLREWSTQLFQDIGGKITGSPKQKWSTMVGAIGPKANENVDLEVLRQDTEAVDINVNGCRYADFFRSLGEPELGALLLCEADFDMAAVGNPEAEFSRTQTIMKGASYCDFRFRMKKSNA